LDKHRGKKQVVGVSLQRANLSNEPNLNIFGKESLRLLKDGS